MRKEKISIIMPVYNAQGSLGTAVESVISQDYPEWELIVIDDGSTDESGALCDRYAELDRRIRVIHRENSGVSNARNVGMDHSSGKWIAFLDSDDRMRKNALKKLAEAAERWSEADLIVFGMQSFSRNTKRYFESVFETALNAGSRKEVFLDLFQRRMFNSPCNKLYRASLLKENAVRFATDFSLGEDLLFNLDFLQCDGYVVGIPDVLYEYYDEGTQSLSRKNREDLIGIQLLLKDLVDARFRNDPLVRRATAEFAFDNIVSQIRKTAQSQKPFWRAWKEIRRIVLDEGFQAVMKECGRTNRCSRSLWFLIWIKSSMGILVLMRLRDSLK